MKATTRLASVMAMLLAAALFAGCGDDKSGKDGASAKPKPPSFSDKLELTVDEGSSSFKPATLTAKSGTVLISIKVPGNAKSKHGVGIDGGVYKDIKGGDVGAGRTTALTVDLKPGKYVIFDSYKKNRNKGFETKLTVEGGKK